MKNYLEENNDKFLQLAELRIQVQDKTKQSQELYMSLMHENIPLGERAKAVMSAQLRSVYSPYVEEAFKQLVKLENMLEEPSKINIEDVYPDIIKELKIKSSKCDFEVARTVAQIKAITQQLVDNDEDFYRDINL